MFRELLVSSELTLRDSKVPELLGMEGYWQLLTGGAWKDRCLQAAWGKAWGGILYGSRGAPVFRVTLPRVNKGADCVFWLLLWKFPPIF